MTIYRVMKIKISKWDITKYQLEWNNNDNNALTIPFAGEEEQQLESQTLLVRIPCDRVTMENSLAFSFKVRYTFTIRICDIIRRYLP